MSRARTGLRAALAFACLTLATPARPAERVTILLDWFVNPNQAPLIIAQETGAFSRHGLAVTFVPPADPSLPVRLLAAGQGDLAIGYQVQLYRQVLQGLPVVWVGTLIDKPLASLDSLKSSGIRNVTDLKGKRIGYNQVVGDVGLAEIDQLLSTAGLGLKDVTMVDVGTALVTSLLTGRVDAVGAMRNFESLEIQEKDATPVAFDYEKYGIPPWDDLIILARRDNAHSPAVLAFMEALREGESYLAEHPDQSWSLFIKHYPDLDNPLNKAAWKITLSHFASDPLKFDEARYRAFAVFLTDHHVIARTPAASEYSVSLE